MAATSVLLDRGFEVEVLDGGKSPSEREKAFAQDLSGRMASGQRPTQRDRRRLSLGQAAPRPLRALWRTGLALASRGIDPTLIKKRILGSDFVFEGVDEQIPVSGTPLARSLATGGLSSAWGAACYTLRRSDYEQWPLDEEDFAPWYPLASELARVDVRADGLTDTYPLYGEWPPATTSPNPASRSGLDELFALWDTNASGLARDGIVTGRSRLAVNGTRDEARPCIRCGLCFYGCPTGAIWSSSRVIEDLRDHPRFLHRPGLVVSRVEEADAGSYLVADGDEGRARLPAPYDAVFLAAGPMSSLRIAADSLGIYDVDRRFLENDMFVVPLRPVSPLRLPREEPEFSLSEAVLAVDPGVVSRHPVHIQLYRITDPLLGPLKEVLCTIPAAMRHVILKMAQGYLIGFIYLNSGESRQARMSIRERPGKTSEVTCDFFQNPEGARLARKVVAYLAERSDLLGLRPMTRHLQLTPPGFSCHFGGTLPMTPSPGPLETDLDGLLHGTRRCYVVDSSVTPAVPAQNFTLTLMANAMRVAAQFADSAPASG